MLAKQKIGISLSMKALALEENAREQLGFSSRSELIEAALTEYIQTHTLQQFPDALAELYASIERSELKAMEDRMAKLLYKIAVEIAQVNLFFAQELEFSQKAISDLRRDAVKQVNNCRGIVSLGEVNKNRKR